MANSNKIISDTEGNEIIILRTDKTVSDFMLERPSSRWDPEYWHPGNTENIPTHFELKPLGDFVQFITYGAILTGQARAFSKQGITYISATTVTDTGINHFLNPLFVKRTDRRNEQNKKPHYGDIVFNRSGVGTLGRQCVFLYDTASYTISDDTDIIRFMNISPFYVSLFLKTKWGWAQIKRRQRGVSGLIKLNFDDIKAITIPHIPEPVQIQCEIEYKKVSELHDLAMSAKKNSNDSEYQRHLESASNHLTSIIEKLEAFIQGQLDQLD